jgi:hypothetical protein
MLAHINFHRAVERTNATLHAAYWIRHDLPLCPIGKTIFFLSKNAHIIEWSDIAKSKR